MFSIVRFRSHAETGIPDGNEINTARNHLLFSENVRRAYATRSTYAFRQAAGVVLDDGAFGV